MQIMNVVLCRYPSKSSLGPDLRGFLPPGTVSVAVSQTFASKNQIELRPAALASYMAASAHLRISSWLDS